MSAETVVPIRRALLSVSDKQGLVDLARSLHHRGVELLASGGTHRALVIAGLPVIEIADYTGQAEILGGRVKTLHPRLHGGILARRDVADDLATVAAHAMGLIDLVVVNLYPFEQTVAHPDVTFAEAVENIDIGGPSLIRGAAKNHAHVVVLTRPDQYLHFIARFEAVEGTTLADRQLWALEAFELTARYDRAIAAYLTRSVSQEDASTAESDSGVFPATFAPRFQIRTTLRYGENPHQRAAFYTDEATTTAGLASARVLHGKELSYNNLLDLDSALRLIRAFAEPAATILKHNNPCGASVADDLATAFELGP